MSEQVGSGDAARDLQAMVDELHRAEDELAHQNDELLFLHRALDAETSRYRRLFDTAPVAYFATDRWGKILDANVAASELLDIPARFLVGKPITVYVEASSRRQFRAWLLDLLSTSERGDVSLTMRRRSGVAFHADVRAVLLGDEVGWTIRDVSEERHAEEQLWELNRELEERIAQQAGEVQAVYDQLPVGVAIVDAATGRVREANRRAQELLDAVAENVDVTRAAEHAVSRHLEGEHPVPELVALTSRSGETAVYEVSAAPLRDERGLVTATVLTLDDVTDRERRERADREFVSNAAHQIRTPITALMSTVAALQAGAKDDPAERERFLSHLARESERLARLADALLVLARVTRGEADADLSVVPLRPLLEQLVSTARVPVDVQCAAETAAVTNGPLLEQALQNVLDNAIRHGAPPITVSASCAGDQVLVEIKDAGAGMSEADRGRVLERFFRSSSDKSGGFGLGLAIAAEAARAAGAELALHSAPGAGTTVGFLVRGARLRPKR